MRGGEGSHHAGAAGPTTMTSYSCCHVEHVIELPWLAATGPVERTRGIRQDA